MPTPSDAAVLAWTRLVRAHAFAMRGVENALKTNGLPPLAWYDVLLELERKGPLRPKALQAELLLAQPNLSRLLDRLVDAGLVERMAYEHDRRGQLLTVTSAGRRLRRRMWSVYARAIHAAIGRLPDAQAQALADLLASLTGRSAP